MQSIANAARNSEEDEDAADWKEAAMQIPTRLQQPPPVSRILRGGTGEPVPVIENYFETINQTTPVSIGDSGNIHSQPRQEFHPQLVVSVKCTELVWKLWSGFDWPANQEAERLKRQRKPVTADKPVNNDLYGSEIEIIVSERGNESTVRFIEHQHSIPAVEGESHGSTDELSGDNETRQQSPAERFARNDRNSMQCIMKQLNVAYKVFSLPGTADNIADDDYDYYRRSSHLQLNVRDVDVLDDLSTSVWHKFLTSCQPMDDLQDRQRLRETNSDMIVLQLTGVRPDLNRPRSLEYRLHVSAVLISTINPHIGLHVAGFPSITLPRRSRCFDISGTVFRIPSVLFSSAGFSVNTGNRGSASGQRAPVAGNVFPIMRYFRCSIAS
jgi:hypothetical protein